MELKLIRRVVYTLLIALAIGLGLLALFLLGQTSRNSAAFGQLHEQLLIINALGAGILTLLIVGNIVRLFSDYLRKKSGAKLRAKMLAAFVGVSVAPLAIVYIFAVEFLNQGIESWFDVEVERGLGDAITLSRSALDGRLHTAMERTQIVASELLRTESDELVAKLTELRGEYGATELTLFGRNYFVIATSSQDFGAPFPRPPPEDVSLQLRQARTYVGLDPIGQGRYQVRAALVLPTARLGGETLTLQALYPVEGRIGALVDSVENTFSRYTELVFLRDPLKSSLTLTLTLVLLLSVLAAVYGGFFFARRMVAPILSVVAGTHAVARGNFDTRLPVARHDEIGFLIDSFNQMIERLSDAREAARLSQQQVENERAQLAIILARLSTGVIALTGDGRIRIANDAASQILETDLTGMTGESLTSLAASSPALGQFMNALELQLDSNDPMWRDSIVLRTDAGRRELMCAATELTAEDMGPPGMVVVFDDVTNLLQAQRDAAWGEVARRLAHEIKNPLTPIQLSAERIRRRYLSTMKDMEAQVLDRATHTIVQQVEAMRDMVNAFSEYARAPQIRLSRFQLNQLIREVAFLYSAQESQPELELHLDQDLHEIEADAVRMRQVLHNLIRNSMEALAGRPQSRVDIYTRRISEKHGDFAEIRVQDNGPGLDPETLDQLFDPYVTTKSKGTGLGLAIVKKLVEEHGGNVTAENLTTGGACVRIRIPVGEYNEDGSTDGQNKRPEARRERA